LEKIPHDLSRGGGFAFAEGVLAIGLGDFAFDLRATFFEGAMAKDFEEGFLFIHTQAFGGFQGRAEI
jgi:hypothetical protein